MKYILILSLLLSGCGYDITQLDLQKTERFCKEDGGIYSYHIAYPIGIRIDCIHGKSNWLENIKED